MNLGRARKQYPWFFFFCTLVASVWMISSGDPLQLILGLPTKLIESKLVQNNYVCAESNYDDAWHFNKKGSGYYAILPNSSKWLVCLNFPSWRLAFGSTAASQGRFQREFSATAYACSAKMVLDVVESRLQQKSDLFIRIGEKACFSPSIEVYMHVKKHVRCKPSRCHCLLMIRPSETHIVLRGMRASLIFKSLTNQRDPYRSLRGSYISYKVHLCWALWDAVVLSRAENAKLTLLGLDMSWRMKIDVQPSKLTLHSMRRSNLRRGSC